MEFSFSIRHLHSAESTKRTFSRTVWGVALLQAAAPGTCVAAPPRVSFFAALAALLAGVGIYGAISFSVAQRTREFGLRIALGAGSRAIISMTLARTARLALSGAACGLGLALMLGALLKTALYLAGGQHAGVLHWVCIHDPVSLAAAATVMLGLAVLAALAPAARAARVEPLAALRHET